MDGLEKVSYIIKKENEIKKEFIDGVRRLLSRIVSGEKPFIVRDVYQVVNSLRRVDKQLYKRALLTLSEKFLEITIKPSKNLKIYIGRYSPELDYERTEVKSETYIERIRGGFPTLVGKGYIEIFGTHPDIDSTSSGVNLIIDAAREMNIFGDEIDNAIRESIKYLESRDINKDGLLEQGPNEDWAIGLYRNGSVLYSNALYLSTVEKAFNLYIDKDQGISRDLEEDIQRCYDSIERYLWLEDHYIDSINLRGGLVLRYSLDTTELIDTITYSDHSKFKIHLQTILNRLSSGYDRWVLYVNKPYTKHSYKIFKRHIGYNGGIVPYYLAKFSKALAEYGLIEYSSNILSKAIEYKNYEWLMDNRIYKKGDNLKTLGALLNTIDIIKNKIRE